MKQLPNLLKQESSAAATYISILLRMYNDPREDRVQSKDDVEKALIPYSLQMSCLTFRLCLEIVEGYVQLDEEHQQRNIIAWRPTLVEILEGFASFSDADVVPPSRNDLTSSFPNKLSKCIRHVSRLLIGTHPMKYGLH